jgi:hypothetical protein
MTRLALGSSLLVLALAGGGSSASDTVISVFVSAGNPATGFVDPDSKDSAKDLKQNLRKKKSIRLVEDQAKADVWVRVERRYKQGNGGQVAVQTSPTTAVAAAMEDQVVVATLIAGDYSTPLVGADWYSWGSAAGKLGGAIEKWVKENREQLIARRPKN